MKNQIDPFLKNISYIISLTKLKNPHIGLTNIENNSVYYNEFKRPIFVIMETQQL